MTYFLSVLGALAVPYAVITIADRAIQKRNARRLDTGTRKVMASAAKTRVAS